MRIEIPKPQPLEDGEFTFYVTPGYGKSYGTIWLDEARSLVLDCVSAEDCDRIIRAAAKVRSQVLAYRAEAAVAHGTRYLYKGTCQLCGKPEDDELHAEPEPEPGINGARREGAPAPVKCLDKYDRLGNTDYCQRDEGHAGQHAGRMGRCWNAAAPLELKAVAE